MIEKTPSAKHRPHPNPAKESIGTSGPGRGKAERVNPRDQLQVLSQQTESGQAGLPTASTTEHGLSKLGRGQEVITSNPGRKKITV